MFKSINRKILNIETIKREMYDVDNLVSYKSSDLKKEMEKLLEARTHLNLSITEVKSLFDLGTPGENNYIASAEKKGGYYTYLNACLGVANSILDRIIKEIIESERGTEVGANFNPASVKINLLREKLIEYSNGLVISPLLNSYKKFEKIKKAPDKNGEIIDPNLNLFSFLVFHEFYRNAQVIGATERQIGVFSQKITNINRPEKDLSSNPENPEMVKEENYLTPSIFEEEKFGEQNENY